MKHVAFEVPDFEIVPIKGFGRCTLIHMDHLSEEMRSYSWVMKNYQTLSSMKEFPILTREQLGNIVTSLIIYFGTDARNRGDAHVLVSGSHEWNGLLDKKTFKPIERECVTVISLVGDSEGYVIDYWPSMYLWESVVINVFPKDFDGPVYTLFWGQTV